MHTVSSFLTVAIIGLTSSATASPFPGEQLTSRSLFPRTSCGTSGSASCHNTTTQSNLCCFESPGGLLTQTQFWDVSPSTGPSNSWTVHGLWPDHCDGTFDSSCDPSRAYTGISTILNNAGQSALVDYMNTYWVDINGDNESFWEHEWGKHGTCMSTLKPACVTGGVTGQDAVYYFQRAVALFKTVPTYDLLASQGITPSTTATYTLSQLTSALKAASGFTPALDCSGSNINQIYWYFNLKGSVIDGTFVPIDAPFAGSCASSGLKYPPKTGGGTPTTTTTGPAPTGLPAKATLQGSSTGCILSLGTWSTQTCASFTIASSGNGFTLTSSKGSCGVSGGAFSCGSGVSSTFTATTSGSKLLLTYSGSTAWTSDAVPSGTVVQTVYTGSSHASDYTLTITSV